MKSAILTVALTATLTVATGAQAERVNATNNYIEQFNLYDSSINKTVPGVRLRVDGKNTVYQIGDHGLTRNIVFDHTGKSAEAWAREALGLDLDARICGSGGKDGDAPYFGGC